MRLLFLLLAVLCLVGPSTEAAPLLPKVVTTLHFGSTVWSISFSPSGKQMAVATESNIVFVYDTSTWKIVHHLEHDGKVSAVAYAPDGRTIAIGKISGGVRIWTPSGQKLRLLNGVGGDYIAFSPNGKFLAAGAHSGQIALFDTSTWQVVRKLSVDLGNADGLLSAIAFSPDGRLFAAAHGDGVEGDDPSAAVKMWRLSDGKLVRWIYGNDHFDFLQSISYTPSGKNLLIGSVEVAAMNVATGHTYKMAGTNTRVVTSMCFQSRGNLLAISLSSLDSSGDRDYETELLDATSYKVVWRHKDKQRIEKVILSPDGRTLAVGGDAGNVMLYSIGN